MTRLPITPRPALNNNSRRPTAARPASLGLLMHSSVAEPNQLRSYLRLQRVEAISSAIEATSKKPSQKPLKPYLHSHQRAIRRAMSLTISEAIEAIKQLLRSSQKASPVLSIKLS